VAIDYGTLRSLTARELITAFSKDGFSFVRQTGSHQRFRHADGRRVTVAPHGRGDTFTVKTLKSMIGLQARWDENDLVRARACEEINRFRGQPSTSVAEAQTRGQSSGGTR
jgi:predicted RNA binding protein YcfA (HicA-like mRNA interferase family)